LLNEEAIISSGSFFRVRLTRLLLFVILGIRVYIELILISKIGSKHYEGVYQRQSIRAYEKMKVGLTRVKERKCRLYDYNMKHHDGIQYAVYVLYVR
jgi:hypothetical protein